MKYALFSGLNYYPQGGALDFKAFSESIGDLQVMYSRQFRTVDGDSDTWAQIVEVASMRVIWKARGEVKWEPLDKDATVSP